MRLVAKSTLGASSRESSRRRGHSRAFWRKSLASLFGCLPDFVARVPFFLFLVLRQTPSAAVETCAHLIVLLLFVRSIIVVHQATASVHSRVTLGHEYPHALVSTLFFLLNVHRMIDRFREVQGKLRKTQAALKQAKRKDYYKVHTYMHTYVYVQF